METFCQKKEKGSDLLGPWHRSEINILPDVAGMEANYFAAADVIKYMARTMPNLPDIIAGRHLISPLDLDTEYGLTGYFSLLSDQAICMNSINKPAINNR